jgi:hypothetical protein
LRTFSNKLFSGWKPLLVENTPVFRLHLISGKGIACQEIFGVAGIIYGIGAGIYDFKVLKNLEEFKRSSREYF